MNETFWIYSVIAVAFSAVDLLIAYRAFQKPERIARALGLSSVFAGVTTLSYLFSLVAESPLATSVASSVYFAAIDWMLVSLVWFALQITEAPESDQKALQAVGVLAALDTAVFAANIFTGVSVTYTRLEPVGITYGMNAPYILHLVFTYLLVLDVLCILLYKCLRTPRQYRNQYLFIVAAVLVVVLINALFLFPNMDSFFTKVDCSVLGYSLGLFLMQWAAFDYRSNDMLRGLSMTIFENIDQGVVLFDYTNRLIMHNRRSEEMLAGLDFEPRMTLAAFMERCGIPSPDEDQYTVQCDVAEGRSLRCDCRRLRDARQGAIGSLIVFTDIALNTDITSGFVFARDFSDLADQFSHPTAIVIFDLTGLREVNRTLGRDAGDRLIRELAKQMRRHMPPDSQFLRGYEANLVAVCPRMTERDVKACAEAVVAASEARVVYGVSDTREDGPEAARRDLRKAVELARHSIQAKKALSSDSVRSQALNSLVRALEEADSDTEAHVQRTQRIGAALGERLSLTDVELADLRLLCLLHDIGKIGIPLEILNKPGKLTDEEWAMLQTHPDKGYQIAMSTDEMKPIAGMILSHHERWDGGGYPRKLAGEAIPLLSRIIAIVDAYDAMVNDRSYRRAMPPQRAQEEIRRNAGSQFDPVVAAEFLKMLEEHPEFARGDRVGAAQESAPEFALQTDQGGEGSTTAINYSRYILSQDNLILEVDDQFVEITGYSREEAVGRLRQIDLIPADSRAHYMAMVGQQFTRGNSAYLSHELLRRDGTRVRVACYGKLYFDSAVKAFKNEIIIFEL